jgi:hypothetical protein
MMELAADNQNRISRFVLRRIIIRKDLSVMAKKKNVYLPSLKMKVPDRVYVLGHSYTYYTYCCYANHFYAYRLDFINV